MEFLQILGIIMMGTPFALMFWFMSYESSVFVATMTFAATFLILAVMIGGFYLAAGCEGPLFDCTWEAS